MLYLAAGYNSAGDYQEAIKLLDLVLANDKGRAEAYYQRGMAYMGLVDFEKATPDFQLAIGYDPKGFDAYIGLAQAYISLGFPGDAYVQIKDNADRLAHTDVQKAQVYYWEAIALDALENASALVYWQKLLGLPEDVMPAEWRIKAQERILASSTITPTHTVSQTPTQGKTPTRTATPSKTPTPTPTRTKIP
jgi:tetratricopeptide (TPR) repeat protein